MGSCSQKRVRQVTLQAHGDQFTAPTIWLSHQISGGMERSSCIVAGCQNEELPTSIPSGGCGG